MATERRLEEQEKHQVIALYIYNGQLLQRKTESDFIIYFNVFGEFDNDLRCSTTDQLRRSSRSGHVA